jgi:hypothetical protein
LGLRASGWAAAPSPRGVDSDMCSGSMKSTGDCTAPSVCNRPASESFALPGQADCCLDPSLGYFCPALVSRAAFGQFAVMVGTNQKDHFPFLRRRRPSTGTGPMRSPSSSRRPAPGSTVPASALPAASPPLPPPPAIGRHRGDPLAVQLLAGQLADGLLDDVRTPSSAAPAALRSHDLSRTSIAAAVWCSVWFGAVLPRHQFTR